MSTAIAAALAPGAARCEPVGAAVDELVVTASKREERLVDVPIAVTAVQTANLAATGNLKLEDYSAKIPGLIVSNSATGGGNKTITLRGIGASFGSGPTVAVYVNDVPFNNSTRATRGSSIPDFDPTEFQRIEVLRGPQGTLYGGGTIGGVLKFVGRDPQYGRFSGRAEVGGSAIDGGGTGYSIRGGVNVPVAENVALSMSGHYTREPGFIDNPQLGTHNVNSADNDGAHAELAVKLTPDLSVRLEGYAERDDAHGTPIIDLSSATGKPIAGDLQVSRAPNTDNLLNDFQVAALHVDANLGFADLASITSYRKNHFFSHWDYSPTLTPALASIFGVPNTTASNIENRDNSDKFTEELRLTSPSSGRFTWQLGAYYTKEDDRFLQQLFGENGTTGAILALPTLGTTNAKASFREYAVYGNADVKLTDNFDVTVGLRYSDRKLSTLQSAFGTLLGNTTYTVTSKETPTTFMVSPRYHFAPDVMAYFRIATGDRPGGANQPLIGVPESYGPDKATNYELGFKADLLDRTISLDIDAFYISWTNIQTFGLSSLHTSYIFNGGEARSQGLEASGDWRPIQGLTLSANVALTDAVLTQNLPAPTPGLKGDRLPEVPKVAGQLGIDYEWPILSAWTANVGAAYRHVGSRPDAFEAGRYTLPSYDTLDLHAGVHNATYALNVFANNLGDERGQLSSLNLAPERRVAIIQPRTFGFTLSSKF